MDDLLGLESEISAIQVEDHKIKDAHHIFCCTGGYTAD